MSFTSGIRRYAKLCSAVAGLVMVILLIGCSKDNAPDPRNLTAMVSVEGSDTMADLVKKLAQAFMKENEGVPVSVSGHDSGTGILALLNRTTDLAAASRGLTADEEKLAHTRRIHLRRVTIARDSIAVIVNSDNPVSQLTMEQLKKIYTGEISNWHDLGGKDQAIKLCGREPASGTARYFQEHVLKDAASAKGVKVFNSHEGIINEVQAQPPAIGYVGMEFATKPGVKVKRLDLKLMTASSGVEATPVSTTGDYPLSRPLFFFLDRDAKESVRKFVDFCLSEEGQKVVVSSGFVKVGQDATPSN